MSTFKTIIVTPEKKVLEDDVEAILVPGTGGNYEILAGHAPLIGTVGAGVLKVVKDGKPSFLAIGSGIIEVSKGVARLMLDAALPSKDQAEAKETARQKFGSK